MGSGAVDKVDGYGYGSGSGDGYGSGYGYGYGSGSGSGDGYGDGRELREYMGLVDFPTALALALPNAEVRREAIQRIGPDRFFSELSPEVIHEDTDGAGNPRSLLRIPMQDAELGYLAAVRVVCPTTGRVYHLFPDQRATTCQEAVASTFGLPADQYNPERES